MIVGGVNGCGKSTFARTAAGTTTLLGQTAINPDDLTIGAAHEATKNGWDLGSSGANVVAVERAEKQVWRAIAEERSVAIETVLSSDKFIAVVEAARGRGYRTRLVFVALPNVEMAIARVAARVAAGGHGVEEPTIRSRWKRSHRNLTRFASTVDDLFVFSNEHTEASLIAEREGRSQKTALLDPDALPAVTEALIASAPPA